MKEFFLSMEGVGVTIGGLEVLKQIDFQFGMHEQWAIIGTSGSGKSVLAGVLSGRQPYSGKITLASGTTENFFHSVVLVEQQHRFKDISNQNHFYYQQRFNSSDAERTLTVREELEASVGCQPRSRQRSAREDLLKFLQMEHLLEEPLIQLSNGENKRLQLIKALLKDPEFLILDQPFVGLDPEGRKLLHRILNRLHEQGFKLLLMSTPSEIPACFTHLAVLEKGSILSQTPVKEYRPRYGASEILFPRKEKLLQIQQSVQPDFEFAVRMLDTTIRYGAKEILSHVSWELRRGDKCCISGPNGAGKSTLLSLVCGDNPQAYANEIYLFDKRRGTGESIWDIKRRIGFVSPEMHLYFEYAASCFEAVASGLFDTIGLFRQLSEMQQVQVNQWMEIFDLGKRKHQLLSQLSAGEQRLVLLARALIKSPSLLVLDEPCQGLDDDQIRDFKNLINLFCHNFNTTLIYVSHNLEDVPESVNHFLRIEKGRVVSNTRAPELPSQFKNQ